MGGMIAQQVAIDHPRAALSLCSIMSTTGNRRYRFPRWRAFALLMAKPPVGREAYVEQAVRTFKVIGSPAYPMDEARFRDLVGRAYDRSFHPPGVARQLHAINCSGNRTARLHRVRMPALVIHGTDDPLVRPVGGRETARAIPGARLQMVEGMGHDLPRALWPTFVEESATNAARAPASPGQTDRLTADHASAPRTRRASPRRPCAKGTAQGDAHSRPELIEAVRAQAAAPTALCPDSVHQWLASQKE